MTSRPAPIRVAVVDDNSAFANAVCEYLAQWKQLAVVGCAGSGLEALRLIEAERPHLVLMDLIMPGMDGLAATRDIPVLIASVLDERQGGPELGAEDYSVKPVNRDWLLGRLQGIAGRRPQPKLLLIDDEEVARYILKGYLADTRYRIIEAADGAQGLQLAQAEQPDVIFLDLAMPGMNGFEVLNRLKENPATQHIPVIVNSSRILDEQERLRLGKQAVALLSKDAVSRDAAIASVRGALSKAVRAARREAITR